ncbi:hypothetical protein B296_00029744 [Ensete ventricosum]|uniref:Uncharacterized protein n=1 Tax=Ensete ventricosum TaxID=4639 RepID=A0A426YEV6_ENSVE|nr:hypothetical protein B296_00029744 [Ensete ventricosum]
MVWVFTLRFESDLRIASCSGSLLDLCAGISSPCRGAVTACGRAANYDVYLPLHGAFRVERWLARSSYKSVEVAAMYESLGDDILVGPLQHLRYSHRGSLHERPKEAERPDPNHEYLDNQRRMHVGNGPDLLCEKGEVQTKVLVFFLLGNLSGEIVYPCIPDPDGEDEGGQASSSLAVSTRWISAAKLLTSGLATLALVGSRLRTKGGEVAVVGLPRRSVESREGCLPQGCWVLSILATSGPPSRTKILLDDPLCPWSQHNMVRPAGTGATQQDLELGEDTRSLLGPEMFWSSRGFFLVLWSSTCKKRPSSGGGPPN